MSVNTDLFVDRRPAFVPLWRESLAWVEWARLRVAPVFWGVGIKRGDRSAVIPIPGFLGFDLYLFEMRSWLARVGYRPYRSGIGHNAECLDKLLERLLRTVDRASQETQRPVHLVGHSLGGLLARAAAVERPHQVASVITMGSPIRGIRSHPFVLRLGDIVGHRVRERSEDVHPQCYSGSCDCRFVQAARQQHTPESVRELAIYTRDDGVVSWRFCLHHDPSRDREVKGTHVGLAFNAEVYRVIADFLAQ